MGTTAQLVTAEQLLEMPGIERAELIRGEIVEMVPPGAEHGRVAARLTMRLANYAECKRLGVVYGETGFRVARDPDTVRAPDVAFVRASRASKATAGFFEGAPDLAIEVVSPNDSAAELFAKVQDWLGAGAATVWVVDPRTQTVSVYGPRGSAHVLSAADRLAGDDVLPGFDLPVAEIFAE